MGNANFYWRKDGKCMPGQQKGNGKKTGHWSNPQFSSINTSDVFTDYDAIEILHNVLQKKLNVLYSFRCDPVLADCRKYCADD